MNALQKYSKLVCCALMGLGILATVLYLNKGLTYDELYTAASAHSAFSLPFIWQQILTQDVNAPLYNLLLHAWNVLIPAQTEITLRLPSLLFSLGTVCSVWLKLPKPLTHLHRFIFIGMLLVNTQFIYYTREARCYALLLLLCTWLTFKAVDLASRLQQKLPVSYLRLLAFSLAGLAACYTHYFGAALFFSLSAILLVYAFYYKCPPRRWCIAPLLVLAAFVPWLWLMLQSQHATLDQWWITTTPFQFTLDISALFFGHALTAAVLIALGLVGTRILIRKNGRAAFFSPVTLVPLAAILLVLGFIFLLSPKINLLYARYALVLLPAVYLLAARALGAIIARDHWMIILLPLLLASFLYPHIFKAILTPQRGFNPTKSSIEYLTRTCAPAPFFAYVENLHYPAPALEKMIQYYPARFQSNMLLLPQNSAELKNRVNQGELVNIWMPIPTPEKINNLIRSHAVRVLDINYKHHTLLVGKADYVH